MPSSELIIDVLWKRTVFTKSLGIQMNCSDAIVVHYARVLVLAAPAITLRQAIPT